MGALKELKVYVSEEFHGALMAEVGQCSCSISSFVRSAIARELIRRRVERKARQPELPMTREEMIGDGNEL